MISQIIEDYRTQREGLLAQGFWALMVYRVSHRRIKCKIPIIRQIWFILNRLAGKVIEIMTGIMLPESAVIGRRLSIEHFGAIIVHGRARIGDDCVIRQGVTIGNSSKVRPTEAPIIGDRVDIGAGAKIMGAIVIGDDVVIGANAVVIRDVPAGSLAVGVPANTKSRS